MLHSVLICIEKTAQTVTCFLCLKIVAGWQFFSKMKALQKNLFLRIIEPTLHQSRSDQTILIETLSCKPPVLFRTIYYPKREFPHGVTANSLYLTLHQVCFRPKKPPKTHSLVCRFTSMHAQRNAQTCKV